MLEGTFGGHLGVGVCVGVDLQGARAVPWKGTALLFTGGWDVGMQPAHGIAASFPLTVTSGYSVLLMDGSSQTSLVAVI